MATLFILFRDIESISTFIYYEARTEIQLVQQELNIKNKIFGTLAIFVFILSLPVTYYSIEKRQ